MLVPILTRNAGTRARTPEQQVDLIVRIMDGRHLQDVADRAKAELGARAVQLGPLDLTRNVMRAYVRRVNQAHLTPPPFVDDLREPLAMAMGDHSARTTIDLYAQAGGRPMPTPQATVSSEAMGYRIAAGYAGVLIGYSERSKSIYLELVKPDVLRPEYTSHDPTEPTVIRHLRQMMFRGRWVEVEEVYDLTDLDSPSYVVYASGEDVTEEIHGQTFVGDDYWWRYEDGTPYHRIVVTGDTRHPYATNELVEATLSTCVLWTHWHAGIRDAGHPQRHVRGLGLAGMDTDSGDGAAGVSSGPETIIQWVDLDPERPGTHWQDIPGFDPGVVGTAIRDWEMTAMSSLGLPVGYERTGGEPLEHERQALASGIAAFYPDARRLDSEILRRAAAMANRTPDLPSGLSETPYGVLYREEVGEALAEARAAEPPPVPAGPPAMPADEPPDLDEDPEV